MTEERGKLWTALACFVLAGLVLLAMCGCSARSALPVASGADLMSTEVALRSGLSEGNPMAPDSTAGRVAVKVGVTAGIMWICDRLEADGHRTAAQVLRWLGAGAFAAATINNVALIMRED